MTGTDHLAAAISGGAASRDTADSGADSSHTGVIFASILAIALTAAYATARIGFANPAEPLLKTLGLSLFFVAGPYWISRGVRRSDGAPSAVWWASQEVITMALMLAVAVAGMFTPRGLPNPLLLFALVGAFLFLATLVHWWAFGRAVRRIALACGAAVFGLWCAGVVWGTRYKTPLFWETLAYRADIHHDPLYYASMANMIRNYGVPSTGLDGVPLINYHYGSSWLFAQWANLLEMDTLTFFSLGYPIIGIPFFFGALLLFVQRVRASVPPALPGSAGNRWGFWLVFSAGTIGLIPARALDAVAIWNRHVLISESYLFALPTFLLMLGTGMVFFSEPGFRPALPASNETVGERPLSVTSASVWRPVGGAGGSVISSLMFLLVAVPASLATLGFLKVSLMILMLALQLYLAARLGLWRRPLIILSIGLSVAVSAITYDAVSLDAHNRGLVPLAFIRAEIQGGWRQFFPVLHLLWSWLFVVLRLAEEKPGTPGALWRAWKENRLLDVEVVLLIAVLGVLPGLVVDIHGGSAIYFSDVQRWVALSFMLARTGYWLSLVRRGRSDSDYARSAELPLTHRFAAVRLSTVLMVIVFTPFMATLVLNTVRPPLAALRGNVELRRSLLAESAVADHLAGTRAASITNSAMLADGARRSEYYPLVATLRAIDALPLSEKKRTALFVPQAYTRFWRIFDSDRRCTFAPFVGPAASGLAMLDGMPPVGCTVTDQYNMAAYRARTREQQPADVADEALCRTSRRKGFQRVLVLEPGRDMNRSQSGTPVRRYIECRGKGRL